VRDRWGLFSFDAMLNPLKWAKGPWQALLVLLLVVVSYLALTPKPLEGSESGLDKVGHLLAFIALGFTGYLGLPARTALPFCLARIRGLLEVLQMFVPGRSAEWGDLLADGIGIGVGIGLAAFVSRCGLRQRPDAYTVLK